ncbi:MAG: NUDIX hydrolase [Elusimicrobiota bacterium]
MKLKEIFLKRLKEVQGRAVGFRIDEIKLPNHKKATREYLNHPGAVGIIPFIDKNHVVLVRQYRYPVQEETWEIPAGKLDNKEPLLSCAKRELEEETGFKSNHLTKLLSFWPTAAFANEIIHIYIAKKLTKGHLNPDEDEFLNAKVWPIKKVYNAIRSGKIKDSKTIIAFLSYKTFKG